MAVMAPEIQQLFNENDSVVFCTARADGQPNACIVGIKCVVDDETVYVSDQFFKKTLANVQANEKVSLVFWKGMDAYQIYGTARYANEGDDFAAKKEWADGIFAKMGAPMRAKGGCFIHVDEIFTSTPGPEAGSKIA